MRSKVGLGKVTPKSARSESTQGFRDFRVKVHMGAPPESNIFKCYEDVSECFECSAFPFSPRSAPLFIWRESGCMPWHSYVDSNGLHVSNQRSSISVCDLQ